MENMKNYTALFIIHPEKEGSIDEVKTSISSVIKENSGNIENENMVGKKTIAYPIKKNAEGIYYEVFFSAPPEAIADMSRQFRINTDILRTLIDRRK